MDTMRNMDYVAGRHTFFKTSRPKLIDEDLMTKINTRLSQRQAILLKMAEKQEKSRIDYTPYKKKCYAFLKKHYQYVLLFLGIAIVLIYFYINRPDKQEEEEEEIVYQYLPSKPGPRPRTHPNVSQIPQMRTQHIGQPLLTQHSTSQPAELLSLQEIYEKEMGSLSEQKEQGELQPYGGGGFYSFL